MAERICLRRASGAHGDDRLGAGETTRDSGELARVSDALQVEQDDLGGLVVLPELQEIVSRDISAVTGRDEGRDAEPSPSGPRQNRASERSALAEEADRRSPRHDWRERGVEPDRGVGVDDPHRIRSDHAHPETASTTYEKSLSLGTVGPELGVSARDDQESGDPSGTAVVDDGHDLVCGDGHDRDRRGLGDLLDRAVGGDAQHSLTGGHRRAIDRADGACEAAGHEVLQQTMPEGGGVTARAHHDDGVWCNQTHHGLSLGAMLARRTH